MGDLTGGAIVVQVAEGFRFFIEIISKPPASPHHGKTAADAVYFEDVVAGL